MTTIINASCLVHLSRFALRSVPLLHARPAITTTTPICPGGNTTQRDAAVDTRAPTSANPLHVCQGLFAYSTPLSFLLLTGAYLFAVILALMYTFYSLLAWSKLHPAPASGVNIRPSPCLSASVDCGTSSGDTASANVSGNSALPPMTHAARTQTYNTLTLGSLNVGGVEITPNRFCHLLSGFKPLPHSLSLQEFRPSSTSSLRDHERVAMFWGYHLLVSAPSKKEGVALLIHTSISPHRPAMREHIAGRLISASIPLHSDPSMPPIQVASFYGPHTASGRRLCESPLSQLARECAITLGDYNAVMHPNHTTALKAPIWPWLVARERAGTLTDLLIPHQSSIPYTRVRRYGGSKSYIDRAYGSRLFLSLFQATDARVLDFSGALGIQDHDPILVHACPWSRPAMPEARCALWNRRDVSHFQRAMGALTSDIASPSIAQDCARTYTQLSSLMLQTMREINASKPPPAPPADDPSDWSSVVRQLARQAKRRSKVFYRRIKHTLLAPPSQSTLPTPTRKIQRILQRNTPWSSNALEHVPLHQRLPDVPPPTLMDLRKLARASRKKSPGPDQVPPYLLYILPDAAFKLVHECLVACYNEGYLPDDWLISETFCIFKCEEKWQDPDRWRPIAMSNSVYSLFMRWIYSQLYPLISPKLHHRQFGGKQGVSTAHATQIFLDDLEKVGPTEAILAFDVYHAFDSPPKLLIRDALDRLGTPLLLLLLLISLVMERGSTFLRGAEDVVFRTTHGVKQGCPLSCFLFVVVFDIPLRVLDQHGITFSAYVDDICSPAPPRCSQQHSAIVQAALSLIACQLNVVKSEALPMKSPPPPAPVLPKYCHPPCALQASDASLWTALPAPKAPDWSTQLRTPSLQFSTSCTWVTP